MPSATMAQEVPANTKKQLTRADYDQWERLGWSTYLTNDNNWLAYTIVKNDGDTRLVIANLSNGQEKTYLYGSRPVFSEDSQWLCFENGVSGKEARKLRKNKKPFPNKITLINLNSGDSIGFDNITSFSFSGQGHYLAMHKKAAKDQKSDGTDLIIRNLASGAVFNFGNVSSYAWQDKGDLLAMIIDAEDKVGNGVQLFNPASGRVILLDSKEAKYKSLHWREKSDDLLFARVEKDDDYEEDSYSLHIWQGLITKAPLAYVFDHAKTPGFPVDTRVVDTRTIKWSENGEAIFFNIYDRNRKPQEGDESEAGNDSTATAEKTTIVADEEAPAVEIWHSQDAVIIPAQKKRSMKSDRAPYLAVYHFKRNKFVQLGNDLTESIRFQGNTSVLVGMDGTPYQFATMFGRPKTDGYAIDINTGQRKKFVTGASVIYDVDPTGSYVVYAKDNKFFLHSLKTGKATAFTDQLDAAFFNTEDDHPVENFRPYRFVGWEKSGKSFFINSKYDVWQFSVDGSKKRNLTNGKDDRIVYRYFNKDRDQKLIDSKKSLYLSMRGEWSKKSGYAQVSIGKPVVRLIWEDADLYVNNKEKDSNTIVYIRQSYTDSPDLFVTTDNFKTSKQISQTNPFQADFMWGKAELIEFTNKNGVKLQGILYYPANYEEGKKYPMITYIYEQLSGGYHRYSRPSKTSYYNTTVFTTNGYFVLRPDILFDAGDPGISSAKTLEIAVKTVVDMGLVDEKRVGLVGHSWGGYQAAFVPTQTDIFAASVAGAGLTDLISMYGAVTPGFGGMPENNHFEIGQERMVKPPWEDPEGYIRNSPVMNINKLNTPVLFEIGSEDMNVNRRQGVEYYNAARRAGKQFVLLKYAGEGHGLRQRKNQMDYQQKILAWFGYYLKNEIAEDWILKGISYAEQQRRLDNWADN